VNEHPNGSTSNERLEFLGDAILEYITSKELFKMFPDKEEGYLTALRANLVNTQNLASVANKLQVGNILKLSKGEEETGGRTNQSLLANTMEALIGALYLDGGLEASEKFIQENILINAREKASQPLKDAKSMLQEIVQSKGIPAPSYNVVAEDGPDHNKIFNVEVIIAKKSFAEGTGKSKSEAEQKAAKKALSKYL
jgi:ribonuclease-3